MESDPDEAVRLLRQPSSHLSDYSLNSNSTLIASPSSPSLHRQVNRGIEEETLDHEAAVPDQDTHGLGISIPNKASRTSFTRKPVASKGSPGSDNSIPSPAAAYQSGEDRYADRQEGNTHDESNLSLYRPFTSNSDREPLRQSPDHADAEFECRMRKRPEHDRGSWLAVSILALSIYSTIFSAAWLLIPIIGVRYGKTVSTTRGMPISHLSTLYAAVAKSIELSFVTVFVAFVGQSLSKRARFQPKGITIAEMSMRSWVMQPGTMVSRWESVRYAAATRLGVLSLLVALMAMTYTTASDALVTPVLKFSDTEHRTMYGKVSTSFANTNYIMDQCNTPVNPATDPENGRTCIQIEHSGQAYHNYMQYLTTWVDNIKSGNTSNNMTRRPDPVGMVRILFATSSDLLEQDLHLSIFVYTDVLTPNCT